MLGAFLAGCGGKPWTTRGGTEYGYHRVCASALSPDRTKERTICRDTDTGLVTCADRSSGTVFESFDEDCKAARRAVSKAGLLR
jgi:hypothetical protein